MCIGSTQPREDVLPKHSPRALSSARFPLAPGHEAGQYTNIFILQFVSEHCLPAAHYVYHNTISFFKCSFFAVHVPFYIPFHIPFYIPFHIPFYIPFHLPFYIPLVFFRKVFNLDRESVFNPVIEVVQVVLRGFAVIVRERSWKAISFAQFEDLSLMKL